MRCTGATTLATILAAIALVSCDEGPTLLVIDVRTDLVPGVEFDAIRAEVLSGRAAGRSVDHVVDGEADYVEGVRVAELMDLDRGELTVRVTVLRDGAEVVARPVRVTLERTLAVTVVVTRDCRGVECPAADGDPIAAACIGGVCADPSCTEEQPEACEAQCVEDADCPAPAAACARARCLGGACLAVADDTACGADDYCEAESGCQPRDPTLCPPFPGEALDVIALANVTCVASADEPLRCWGENEAQLGDRPGEPVGAPRALHPSVRWRQVAVGTGHWCGVDASDGALRCAGNDWAGQLGDGDGNSTTSDLVAVALEPTSIAAAETLSCAVDADGSLHCWGRNEHGEAGADPAAGPVWEPQAIEPGTTWRSVHAGGPHACGIRTDGALYCWGSNANSDLARHYDEVDISWAPLPIGTDTDWEDVAVGREFVVARKADGSLWSWGGSWDGMLAREGPEWEVHRIGDADDWTVIAAGFRHACGIRAGGALWCWGSSSRGQLGEGVTADSTDAPTRVLPERTWVDVALGFGHTCALDDTGRVWCWGANNHLQLGDGPGDGRAEARAVCP